MIGNYEVFGFYRVNYDNELWNLIIAELDTNFTVRDSHKIKASNNFKVAFQRASFFLANHSYLKAF